MLIFNICITELMIPTPFTNGIYNLILDVTLTKEFCYIMNYIRCFYEGGKHQTLSAKYQEGILSPDYINTHLLRDFLKLLSEELYDSTGNQLCQQCLPDNIHRLTSTG